MQSLIETNKVIAKVVLPWN